MAGEVAGLVLLEPAHEDHNAHMPGPLIERHISPEWLRTGFGEAANQLRLYREWADSFPLGECRIIAGAGHASLHWSHPDAVVQAIHNQLVKLPQDRLNLCLPSLPQHITK